MGEHRPVPTADTHNPCQLVATTGRSIDSSPPFRSNRVVLGDGRAVGLTEPFSDLATSQAPVTGRERTSHRPGASFLLRGGVGAWLGAVTVVGLAAFVFTLTPGADNDRSRSPVDDDDSPGIAIGGAQPDGVRASRARTTGALNEEAALTEPPQVETARSNGPSGGLDLDLGHRSGDTVEESASSAPTTNPPPDGATASTVLPVSAEDGGETSGSTPEESTSPVVLPPPAGPTPSGPPPVAGAPAPAVPAAPPTTRKPMRPGSRPSQGDGVGRGVRRGQDSPSGNPGTNPSNGRAPR